ncbi:MAG: carbohydrate kinase family protein [Acidobacteriota bacterium]
MSHAPFSLAPDAQIVVTGSLAFDQIMVYPGHFKDHILPDKLHVISISFLVNDMRTQRGGCAGNIAYTLALLEETPRIVAAAGEDFAGYRSWLEQHGVDTSGITVFDDVKTACCHITTDKSDNQITGFFVGAMARAGALSLTTHMGDRAGVVIVAPDDPDAMLRHCHEARDSQLPFLFDPSFQVTAMDGAQLTDCARGAAIVMMNDYEHGVFEKKTGHEGDAIFDLVDTVVVTLGGEGSRILRRNHDPIEVPAVPIARFVDPTGAGDAYRAGFLAGLKRGYDLARCGRMGSVAAAYAVEQHGTQEHAYSRAAFDVRYAESFGAAPDDDTSAAR